jgi:hypothetical protein
MQIPSSAPISGVVRASVVWESPNDDQGCTIELNDQVYGLSPCIEEGQDGQAVAGDGPFRGVAVPRSEGCMPSEMIELIVRRWFELNAYCSMKQELLDMGINAIIVEHGFNVCSTYLALDIMPCNNEDGGFPPNEGEGVEGETEGAGGGPVEGEPEGQYGEGWQNVIWDPIDANCGSQFPDGEDGWAIFMHSPSSEHVEPDAPPGCINPYYGTELVPVYRLQYIWGDNPQTTWYRIPAEVGVYDYDCTEGLVNYSCAAGHVDLSIWAYASLGLISLSGIPTSGPAGSSHSLSFWGAQYMLPGSCVVIIDEIVVDQGCGNSFFNSFETEGIPDGGEACAWKAKDGTVLGYKERAQRMRVRTNYYNGTFLAGIKYYSNEYFWVQRIKYPKASVNGYDGYRVYVEGHRVLGGQTLGKWSGGGTYSVEMLHNSGGNIPGGFIGKESGGGGRWLRLFPGPEAVSSTYAAAVNIPTEQYIRPQAYEEGWTPSGGASGGSSGGVTQIYDSAGQIVDSFGLDFEDMRRAVAQGTAVGMELAGNTLAARISDAISSGIANLGGEPGEGSGQQNIAFNGSRDGGGGGSDTGYDGQVGDGASMGGGSGVLGEALRGTQGGMAGGVAGWLGGMGGGGTVLPTWAMTIPWFNGQEQTFVLDFTGQHYGGGVQTFIANVRPVLRSLMLLGIVLYMAWYWFWPLVFSGWLSGDKG